MEAGEGLLAKIEKKDYERGKGSEKGTRDKIEFSGLAYRYHQLKTLAGHMAIGTYLRRIVTQEAEACQ
jgi:hypothetical protein